jgi:SAM-dependent methyltransferase
MDRVAQLLSTTQRSSRILEIGPSHAPIAPKAAGWNTFIVDHATQAELRAKFRGYGVNLEAIEPVDFVWDSGGLADAVPETFHGTFDTIIASHVIEHMPDFVAFFKGAAKLLKPAGTVALAVPDKRYCFDFFQSHSMAGDMIEAHLAGATRHSRRTVFNYLTHIVMADGATAWGQHQIKEFALLHPFKEATKALQKWSDDPNTPYKDYHAWQFTPASFELLVLELGLAGFLDFHLVSTYPTAGSEFIVLLQPGAPCFAAPELGDEQRLLVMQRILADTREQLDNALGPPPAVRLAGEAAARLERIEAGLPAINIALEHDRGKLHQLGAMVTERNESVLARLRDQDRLNEIAELVRTDADVRERIVASLKEIVARLGAQDTALHEIAEVAYWQRRALKPVRWTWRILRPIRRMFGSSA